jgi:hypothetical protein
MEKIYLLIVNPLETLNGNKGGDSKCIGCEKPTEDRKVSDE